MYSVKRYNVSMARERLADVLNEVDRNGSVLIERGDAQYVITAKSPRRRSAHRTSMIETVDPSVANGQWQWDVTATGIRFRGRRSRS